MRQFARYYDHSARLTSTVVPTVVMGLAMSVPLPAQETGEPELVVPRQTELANQFLSLERRLLERAEWESSGNPQRAALLKQAFAKARQLQLGDRLRGTAEALDGGEYGKAIDQQRLLHRDFQTLLDLLLSEGHDERQREKKNRVESYLREVERLLRMQRSVEGQTEAASELLPLADTEAQLAERTSDLIEQMRDEEGPSHGSAPPTQPDEASQPSESTDRHKLPGDEQTPSDQSDPDETQHKDSPSQSISPTENSDSADQTTPPGSQPSSGESPSASDAQPTGESQSTGESQPSGDAQSSAESSQDGPPPFQRPKAQRGAVRTTAAGGERVA